MAVRHSRDTGGPSSACPHSAYSSSAPSNACRSGATVPSTAVSRVDLPSTGVPSTRVPTTTVPSTGVPSVDRSGVHGRSVVRPGVTVSADSAQAYALFLPQESRGARSACRGAGRDGCRPPQRTAAANVFVKGLAPAAWRSSAEHRRLVPHPATSCPLRAQRRSADVGFCLSSICGTGVSALFCQVGPLS